MEAAAVPAHFISQKPVKKCPQSHGAGIVGLPYDLPYTCPMCRGSGRDLYRKLLRKSYWDSLIWYAEIGAAMVGAWLGQGIGGAVGGTMGAAIGFVVGAVIGFAGTASVIWLRRRASSRRRKWTWR